MNGRGHSENRTADLPVRVFYSVAELARAGNVPTYRLLRLLRRKRHHLSACGTAFYVTLNEIRRNIPPLWKSLQAVQSLRGAGGPGKDETPDRSPRAPPRWRSSS